MIEVSHHSSVVIIESENGNEFLVSIYDDTYTPKCFRGAINFLGGNHKSGDKSPFSILIRELKEELSINQDYIAQESNLEDLLFREKPQEINSFAPENDIEIIKSEIIANIIPYKDYLLNFPSFEGRKPFSALTSAFISRTKQDIFELAKNNIRIGKSIKNEGLANICNIEEIIAGRYLCAWATGCALADYKNTNIPNPYNILAISIGQPKNSMKEYLSEFKYKNLKLHDN